MQLSTMQAVLKVVYVWPVSTVPNLESIDISFGNILSVIKLIFIQDLIQGAVLFQIVIISTQTIKA